MSADVIRILEDCVRSMLPDAPATLHLQPIPTGKFNDSYFVDADDRKLVLRVAPDPNAVFLFYEKDMMKQEPELHALILKQTDTPVAPIVAFDDSRERIDRDFILMERLPGAPISDAVFYDRDAVLRRVGDCLARVHAITRDRYGYLGAHAPMEPQATWNDAFRDMWQRLIEDIVGVGHYDEQEAAMMITLLDRHMDCFDRDVSASLLHMDVWAQNILVDNGHFSGLVDWDRAVWGDPEIEFAVLEYCGISEPAFWEGYGARRDESDAAQIRRIFYLLYEIQKYIVIRQGRGNDRAGAVGYKDQALQIAATHLR